MSPAKMEKIEAAVRTALAFNAAFNRQDFERLKDLLDKDCRCETPYPPPRGTDLLGKDAVAGFFSSLQAAHPRSRFSVSQAFGAGDRCVVLWEYGSEPEGQTGVGNAVRGVDVITVRAGRIVRIRSCMKGDSNTLQ